MKLAPSFTTCLGLGLAASPAGLVCDPGSGRFELAEAVNVDIAGGRILRRPGYVRLSDGGYHSLFADGVRLYGVAGDALYAVSAEGTAAKLRGGLTPGARMGFVQANGRIYFGNGFEKGVIEDGVARPWGGGTFPGLDRLGSYAEPPAGHLLALYAGRLWIAKESTVYFTEGAGLFDWIDAAAGFLPPGSGRIRMLRAVADGLYIGDGEKVVFAAGADPKAMTYRVACPVPAVPGTDQPLSPALQPAVAGRELPGAAAVWLGADGIYLGLPAGKVERIKTIDCPAASRGTSLVTAGRYLVFLEP